MKKINYRIMLPVIAVVVLLAYACSKSFVTVPNLGNLSQATLANKAGVEGLLIGAYSMLDGVGDAGTTGTPGLIDATGGLWETSADNWIYGSVAGGDDHKGSDPGDQPDIVPIQLYTETSANGFFDDKWITLYDAIQRCNSTIRTMRLVSDGSMTAADTTEVRAEALFLRALYHFEAKKMWNNIPYFDESISFAENNYLVPNTTDTWPMIEADLNYAIANLPATQSSVGRANSWAAKAFLAKAYMYEKKFTDAQPLLLDIITNGTNPLGVKYALLPKFGDNFDAAHKNGPESIFAAQNSVEGGSNGANGNVGDVLNFPYGGPSTCCGFFQPSYSLANSFKVDATSGLPLLDGSYNNDDLKTDEGLPPAPTTGADWFVIDARPVDPRLDLSVGRRGIPYLDWGLDPGASWVRNQASAGPYLPIKYIVRQSEQGTLSTQYGGWAVNQATADNYVYIRYANILLWYAECAAQGNDFTTATTYVNLIRTRAANTAGWVAGTGTYAPYAANYKISLYPTFADQASALSAIYFENKLEFSSEGHRFFDLVRWGTAVTELNAYIQHELTFNHIPPGVTYPNPNTTVGGTLSSNALPANYYILLTGASFTANHQYYPIPQAQIDASVSGGKSSLTQNPGY